MHTLKVGGAHLLPPPARRSEWRGGPTRGAAPSGVGGASPRRFVDDQARVSMAALARPPQHPRRPLASPSHPPPLPLPATRLRRAGGGRSEKPTWVNLIALPRGRLRLRPCGLPAMAWRGSWPAMLPPSTANPPMPHSDPTSLLVHELSAAIQARRLSPIDLVEA